MPKNSTQPRRFCCDRNRASKRFCIEGRRTEVRRLLDVAYLHTIGLCSDLDNILRRKVGVHEKESSLRHPAFLLHSIGVYEIHPNFGFDAIELRYLKKSIAGQT